MGMLSSAWAFYAGLNVGMVVVSQFGLSNLDSAPDWAIWLWWLCGQMLIACTAAERLERRNG